MCWNIQWDNTSVQQMNKNHINICILQCIDKFQIENTKIERNIEYNLAQYTGT